MAKISPVAAKYIVHSTIFIDGVVDKPDVIGAIFGQTEGLLGNDLELRELQRSGKIGRIEVNDVIDSIAGDEINHVLNGVAQRINHGDTPPDFDILDDHVFQRRGFARAGFTDQIHVPSAVVGFDAETAFFSPKISLGE